MNTEKVVMIFGVRNRITVLCIVMILIAVANVALVCNDYISSASILILAGMIQPVAIGLFGAYMFVKSKDMSVEHAIVLCTLAVGLSTMLIDCIEILFMDKFMIPILAVEIIFSFVIIASALFYERGYRHNALRIAAMFIMELILTTIIVVIVELMHFLSVTDIPVSIYTYVSMIILYIFMISIFMSPNLKDSFINYDLKRSVSEISSTLINDESLRLTEEGLSILRGEDIESWTKPGGDIECQKSFSIYGKGSEVVITVYKWKGEDHLRARFATVMKRATSIGEGFEIMHIGQCGDYVRVYGRDGYFVQFYAGKDDYYPKSSIKKIIS